MDVVYPKASRFLSPRSVRIGISLWFFLLLYLLKAPVAQAQEPTATSEKIQEQREAPRVYIDCDRCDYNHIRREVTAVRYVRDPKQADVHVFITDESTGGGGREYEFSFLGRRAFDGVDYEVTRTIGRNATSDETREEINRVLELGLAPYLMKPPFGQELTLYYPNPEEDQQPGQVAEDPWNHWVFEVYGGRVRMSHESNQSSFNSRWGFYADRGSELRAWDRYWASYLQEQAAEQGREIFVTTMKFAPSSSVRRAMADRDPYAYAEISQNNQDSRGARGPAHYTNVLTWREKLESDPMPLNDVKIYGSDAGQNYSASTGKEATDRLWKNVFAGTASARFHRP